MDRGGHFLGYRCRAHGRSSLQSRAPATRGPPRIPAVETKPETRRSTVN